MENTYDYDVAVTFAGEDRQFVQQVVREVTGAGYKVFYDQDEQVMLWGEDLTEYLPKVYEERARYAVMFVSCHYAAKAWTRFERRSVLLRALEQPTPYLLPVSLDGTPLPGVRSSISFLDGATMGASGIAEAILQKLSGATADRGGSFNGCVPRDEHQATILVGERPAGWEYLLFAYSLVRGVAELHERYLDHRMGYAPTSDFVPEHEVQRLVQRELATVHSISRNFRTVLDAAAQRSAFGEPGEPGNVDEIVHLASRYVSVYQSFIDWASHLRSYATVSDEAHDVLHALARYAGQPVERLRDFVYEFRAEVDTMHAKLIAGEDVTLEITLPLEISPEDSANFDQALERFEQARSG
ncbi:MULTISPECIES: TIR domain-containing protein [unclassified Saccharopolyspora]|uniref:TIR domain-containing protein n=1 Tax=unclassified Saccharopolyspora TaxID=2646250 RepID=UPI001CD31E38|nr:MULTISPECIES: TIR domain-containing protein [unclassified Saccharopolyspora]MCA1186712.1 TIR domain-containing protein [Saccharopolyspora sp. 6T]MCA1278347.1 TIR domain-containing protein [Saccharopolyspora sp. 7B]